MEHALESLFIGVPVWGLIAILAVALLVLGKGADILVDEAVAFSVRMQVPTVIIGATVVSLGTTLPEASVSVMAALSGQPDIALGNAVGSIICDTGLILGIGALISPLPLDKRVVNKRRTLAPVGGCVSCRAACGLYRVVDSLEQRNGRRNPNSP